VNSQGVVAATDETGPIGPVAVSALLFLVAASPLMRGGNRHVALIVLEAAALAFLAAALVHAQGSGRRVTLNGFLLAFLLASPAWLALVYLLPIPASLWASAAGRAGYPGVMAAAGIGTPGWLPLSLVPDATAASLFSGIPILAAFVAGLWLRLRQLKLVLAVFVGVAFLQVVMGLLQVPGGANSSLYFGGIGGRPMGTFANPNHFANYTAMALAVYVWLAWTSLSQRQVHGMHHRSTHARRLALWGAGGMLLVIGILMSRSRGAALAGLPAAMCAFAVAASATSTSRHWRTTLVTAAIALGLAMAVVGFDSVVTRFQLKSMTADASFRTLLATTTLEGAAAFWPWGAGWGTYGAVYPRFQPATVDGFAGHAHHDYAQLLFEGGIFAVLLMAAFGWLAITRAAQLARVAIRGRRLRRSEMAAAICGLGLLGFLLHSFVEFNMHIPANAIAAALLAGAFLRPLRSESTSESDADGDEESNGD
jgi:hypothetical protein